MVAEVVSLGGQRMSVVFHLLAHQGKVIISEELHNFAALNSELDLGHAFQTFAYMPKSDIFIMKNDQAFYAIALKK